MSPKEVTPKEIVDRMMARAINEAAYMIQEGICDRPQDMDLAMITGRDFLPTAAGFSGMPMPGELATCIRIW